MRPESQLTTPVLELTDTSVVRGSVTILDRIALKVQSGEHTALLGPNGSGKSTLLKLLMRIMYPSVVNGVAGQVRIFGQEDWNVWDLRARLGFVSSELDHHFVGGRSGRLTAMQAVLTGMFASELEPDPEFVTASMQKNAREALELLEIEWLANRHVGHLSTGERRRVMLARAMVHRPEALVLDEPTSGLDLRAQDQLLRRLDSLALSGITLILVTHHFNEVLPCVGRTVLMSEGRIDFDGSTSQAMTPSRLSDLFQCALDVQRSESGFWRVDLKN